jgi:hypothetical protein
MINNEFTYKGYNIAVVFSGAAGLFDFYINGVPYGCDKASKIRARVAQVIARKEGK